MEICGDNFKLNEFFLGLGTVSEAECRRFSGRVGFHPWRHLVVHDANHLQHANQHDQTCTIIFHQFWPIFEIRKFPTSKDIENGGTHSFPTAPEMADQGEQKAEGGEKGTGTVQDGGDQQADWGDRVQIKIEIPQSYSHSENSE